MSEESPMRNGCDQRFKSIFSYLSALSRRQWAIAVALGTIVAIFAAIANGQVKAEDFRATQAQLDGRFEKLSDSVQRIVEVSADMRAELRYLRASVDELKKRSP